MATTSCPRGLVNDPYPGSCNLYTDTNSNQICDLSEEMATTTPLPINQPMNSLNLNFTLIALFIIPIFIYALSSKFKMFWNIILLTTFLLTAISTLGYIFGFYTSFLNTIHLHIGTIFLSISLCHIFWHSHYWWGILKKLL